MFPDSQTLFIRRWATRNKDGATAGADIVIQAGNAWYPLLHPLRPVVRLVEEDRVLWGQNNCFHI